MDKNNAIRYIHDLLRTMLSRGASDLFITAEAAPAMKLNGKITPITEQNLSDTHCAFLVRSIMNDRQLQEYEEHMECNFAISVPELARFRVNTFTQRGNPGMVLRHIPDYIPNFKELELPSILEELTMSKRGLILFVGATGSGKSTSMAAMVDFRNQYNQDHIVTIEEPIEFIHKHKQSLITQREVGVDCESYEIAMKNTLRQAPDVILLGEIRDREAMDYAITYAETGHLCVTTLHANSTSQALDRIINFFPEERRAQLLMDLSMNLRAVISQRLIRRQDKEGRIAAVEIMINTPLMADLILKGDIPEMKVLTARSSEMGMQTFDQALFNLIEEGKISITEGMRNADSINDLRLRLKLESRFSKDFDFYHGTENIGLAMKDD